MATLTADVTAEQGSWNVSGMPDAAYLQVDDEVVRVLDQRRQENRLRVERGYAGTTAVTHDSGADLEPVYVPSVGGGGGEGLPEQWTADAEGRGVITADANDGIVLTVTAPEGTEDFGDTVFQITGETGGELLGLDAYGTLRIRGAQADPGNGGGEIRLQEPGGANKVQLRADDGSGAGSALAVLDVDYAQVGASGSSLVFFGSGLGVTQPVVPLTTPDVQDVIDALVALGLISQSD